nr:hypothetical protein BaRGS_023956 [Batillaria attramentaria]
MVETGLEEEALKEEGRRAGEEAGYDKDLSERRGPFRNLVGQTDTLTVQLCVERCWLQRYDFAAMQFSSGQFTCTVTASHRLAGRLLGNAFIKKSASVAARHGTVNR